MRYAIDRFKIGTENEVNADEFYNKYIPLKNKRFFCPECGESVFWRSKGGNQPNKFCHYKKTLSSPECDKRVDGQSDLYLYERVGLSINIVNIGNSQFRLNMIFPAISEYLLRLAEQQKSRVYISANGKERKFLINHTYFMVNHMTEIPIDFFPDHCKNYSIKIDAYNLIKKKWSNYADGFALDGAVFHYGETGGKKIRRGDSITTGQMYYIISRNFNPPYQEIESTKIGSIFLNHSEYFVYTTMINVSVEDEYKYRLISGYLKNRLGVFLLETAPKLIPIWPPITEQDVMIPITNSSTVFCTVSSGNTMPKVYTYREEYTSGLCVVNENGVNTVELPVSFNETIFSVDRKYTGRELFFCKKEIDLKQFEYDFNVEKKKDGILVDLEKLTSSIFLSDLMIRCNAKMELYVGSYDKTYRHIPIRNTDTDISVKLNSSELILTVEGEIVHCYSTKKLYEKNFEEDFDEQDILYQIKENNKGIYVPIPRWVGFVLISLQKKGYSKAVYEVQRIIYNGKIPYGLLRKH